MIKLKSFILNETYIGSCVDIENNKKPISSIFQDATHMAQVVNPDGDNFIQVTPETFYKYISSKEIPQKAKLGKLEYYRIKNDIMNTLMNDEECAIWWIYNVDQNIHYFFQR